MTETSSSASGKLSADEVYQVLRQRIIDHSLPPATRINIVQIAHELGVSATPVREALRLLQGDNLLVAVSNKGYATTEVLNADGVRSLFEFRLLLEPWAAAVASTQRLSNPAHALKREIAAFDRQSPSVREAMISHDSRFHLAIVEATGNPLVIQAYRQSNCHVHLFRVIQHSWDWQRSIDEHQTIAEAIAAADATAAEAAMRAHLLSAFEGFMALLPDSTGAPSFTPPGPARMISGS